MNTSTKVKAGICSATAVIVLFFGVQYEPEKIRISESGLRLIIDYEGCRTNPYTCPAGIPTDGVGNTTNVRGHKTLSDITDDLRGNIIDAEQCVNHHANGKELPSPIFDAVTSITFNVGCSKMRTSTMFKHLNAGDYRAACNEFPRWVYSNGRKLNGLIIRRNKERELCEHGLN